MKKGWRRRNTLQRELDEGRGVLSSQEILTNFSKGEKKGGNVLMGTTDERNL